MGTSSDDVIGKLTAEQALRIVQQLSRGGGAIGEAVRAEAMNVLTGVDWDETAEEVFSTLDSLAGTVRAHPETATRHPMRLPPK